jgi:hypothetical protein
MVACAIDPAISWGEEPSVAGPVAASTRAAASGRSPVRIDGAGGFPRQAGAGLALDGRGQPAASRLTFDNGGGQRRA